MIRKLWSHLLHWKMALLLFLKPLGFVGVGVLAAIDASVFAIPMDAIIAVYVWSNRRYFWVYAIMGAAGSAVGALVPFYIGRTGGEWVLLKRIPRAKYDQMRARFDRHHWLAVLVPAAMPPPFPFKVFAFGAGVFEMRAVPYMVAVFVGRTAHYLVTALLVVYFGPEIMTWMGLHTMLLLSVFAALVTAYLLYKIFRRRRDRARKKTLGADTK
ncbi:MAG TPA: VTT domain-containing protein [Acidobacteriaceae bacterium]|nr:VTT domain-containing protein [Acidobacteriaceae bacterium]